MGAPAADSFAFTVARDGRDPGFEKLVTLQMRL
jgi:hypothetical protein